MAQTVRARGAATFRLAILAPRAMAIRATAIMGTTEGKAMLADRRLLRRLLLLLRRSPRRRRHHQRRRGIRAPRAMAIRATAIMETAGARATPTRRHLRLLLPRLSHACTPLRRPHLLPRALYAPTPTAQH